MFDDRAHIIIQYRKGSQTLTDKAVNNEENSVHEIKRFHILELHSSN